MSEYVEKIINIQTGEITTRNLTAKEILEIEKGQEEASARISFSEKRENHRKSALAKLAALGLTEEEIAAL